MYVLIKKYILDDIKQSSHTQSHEFSEAVNGKVTLPLSSSLSLQQH